MKYNLSKIFTYKSHRVAKLLLKTCKHPNYSSIPPATLLTKTPSGFFKNSDVDLNSVYFSKWKS